MVDPLALRLASTIRATARGLTDAFATPESTRNWLSTNASNVGAYRDVGDYLPTEQDRLALVALRQSVRAIFAEAVAPHPPSSADANALPPFPEALAAVNQAAAPILRQLTWDGGPSLDSRLLVAKDTEAYLAALAESAIEFFTGPLLPQLRVCPAPRCVLYFLKRHPRQEWCSTACGNRARAARFYHQHRD
ncbi:ABATE domain-containing protein [Nocardia sp. NPDC051030]|uniref:CGNR zinc finger domain-containing protein n=1 Tax=Nocardia sp. NPDC051030 TaxID=3155162 RepID=UPI0034356F07